jgi:hypothetical protein
MITKSSTNITQVRIPASSGIIAQHQELKTILDHML